MINHCCSDQYVWSDHQPLGDLQPPGYTRQQVLDSMYGRLEPKPAAPSFTDEDMSRMRSAQEQQALDARLLSTQELAWKALAVPQDLGVDCQTYKWRQNQSHVELYVKLPPNVLPKQVTIIIMCL